MSINTDSHSPLLLITVILIFLLAFAQSKPSTSAHSLRSFLAPSERSRAGARERNRARAAAARIVRHLTKIQSLDGHYREHVDNKSEIFDSVHV